MSISFKFHTDELKKIKIQQVYLPRYMLVNKYSLIYRLLELLGNLKHLLINLLYFISLGRKKAKTKHSSPEKVNALSQVSHHVKATRLKVSKFPLRSPSFACRESGKTTKLGWRNELRHREPDSTLRFSMC